MLSLLRFFRRIHQIYLNDSDNTDIIENREYNMILQHVFVNHYNIRGGMEYEVCKPKYRGFNRHIQGAL